MVTPPSTSQMDTTRLQLRNSRDDLDLFELLTQCELASLKVLLQELIQKSSPEVVQQMLQVAEVKHLYTRTPRRGWHKLPQSVLHSVFAFLDALDMACSAERVCRSWRACARDSGWFHFNQDHPFPDSASFLRLRAKNALSANVSALQVPVLSRHGRNLTSLRVRFDDMDGISCKNECFHAFKHLVNLHLDFAGGRPNDSFSLAGLESLRDLRMPGSWVKPLATVTSNLTCLHLFYSKCKSDLAIPLARLGRLQELLLQSPSVLLLEKLNKIAVGNDTLQRVRITDFDDRVKEAGEAASADSSQDLGHLGNLVTVTLSPRQALREISDLASLFSQRMYGVEVHENYWYLQPHFALLNALAKLKLNALTWISSLPLEQEYLRQLPACLTELTLQGTWDRVPLWDLSHLTQLRRLSMSLLLRG